MPGSARTRNDVRPGGGVTGIYEIGPFRLDAATRILSRSGSPVALGARGVAVLSALVRRHNEFVDKDSIIDEAWPGIVVEESNLPVQIAAIRRALAEVPGGERWIETLVGRGYRFVGPVVEAQGARNGGSGTKRSNLPGALTSFVGRERELAEIKRLLSGRRFLTLVGPGGIGKTRLALQVAVEVGDAYRDGAWLAELGSIRDPLLVPTSLAQVLGIQERAGRLLTDTIAADLRSREALLILDNCEHLSSACAGLAEAILRVAPEATIIATSREPLGVTGEQVYALPALSLPDPGADMETAARSEAVQLFVERVRQQLPDFALTAARASVVAELCIHLDGIPLALELAAARARSLSVEQINARLRDRFKLLTSRSRATIPRQQTLRATLDWSFDLLTEDERMALRRLAIFPGSFTLEAASALASTPAIDEYAVIDLLGQLVSRSLVIADISESATRYRLLETTRAYALEKLAESGELDAIRHRHAHYFRASFERAADDWLRFPDPEWHTAYASEIDNVRAALEWSVADDGDHGISVALAGASGPLWTTLALFAEGVQRLEAATALVDSSTPNSDEARVYLWLGIASEHADPERALTNFERAVALYGKLSDPLSLAHSTVRLARALAGTNRLNRSAATLEEALPTLERLGLPKLVALYYATEGFVRLLIGDPISARAAYEKALRLFREAGNTLGMIACIGSFANVCWATGDLAAAEAAFREAVAMARTPRSAAKGLLGFALAHLAGVLTERGEIEAALEAAREGVPMLGSMGNAWRLADHFALMLALAGRIEPAAQVAGYADASFAAKQPVRESNEARAHERLHALLCEKLAPDDLERLLAEGAKMSEEEACRLALEG